MNASDYQLVAEAKLKQHFADVRHEWSVVKDASDAFAPDLRRYAPRVDAAVGPFSTSRGKNPGIREALENVPSQLRARFDDRPSNPNPRCLLAIEVIYSGSSKHVLGDILNAGALGLYGLVVGQDTQMPKIRRIHRYLEMLGELENPPWLFRNVDVLLGGDN
jgi:hypothetical protein